MIKDMWNFWIDFTEFRCIRKCYIDQMIYGNSIKVRKWWGWKHIPFLEYAKEHNEEWVEKNLNMDIINKMEAEYEDK